MKKYLILASILILFSYVMLVNSPIIIENNDIEEKNTQYLDFEQKNPIKLSIDRLPIIIKGNKEFNASLSSTIIYSKGWEFLALELSLAASIHFSKIL